MACILKGIIYIWVMKREVLRLCELLLILFLYITLSTLRLHMWTQIKTDMSPQDWELLRQGINDVQMYLLPLQVERKHMGISCNSLLEVGGIKSNFLEGSCQNWSVTVWQGNSIRGHLRLEKNEGRMQEFGCWKEALNSSIWRLDTAGG